MESKYKVAADSEPAEVYIQQLTFYFLIAQPLIVYWL